MAWRHYNYGSWGGYHDEYDEDITFYRPDGDTEGKSIAWCRSNGFFEIEDGLWSGDWYWRHFPEKKQELEEQRRTAKQNRRSHEDIVADVRKRRRAELLDMAYNGALDGEYPDSWALAELKKMDEEEYEFQCPLNGCQRRFPTEDEMEWHLESQPGKAHARYRSQHGIEFFDQKALEQASKLRLEELHRLEQKIEAYTADGLSIDELVIDQCIMGPDRLLNEDKYLFEELSMDELLEKDADIEAQVKWLDMVLEGRKRAKKWDETMYTSERVLMHRWLTGKET